MLDSQGTLWEYEPISFPIFYDGKQGTYRPDFYIVKEDKYQEVKGWWRGDAFAKYNAFKEQYPSTKIELIDKIKMEEMGLL